MSGRKNDLDGFLTREACQTVFAQIVGLTAGGGHTYVWIKSSLVGSAEWALNRLHVVGTTHLVDVSIWRIIKGDLGYATTTRLDLDGLRRAVRVAEEMLLQQTEIPKDYPPDPGTDPTLSPTLWSEATSTLGAMGCAKGVRPLIAPTERAGFISTGALRVFMTGTAVLNSSGMFRYCASTDAQCSMTVRDTEGTASGWTGKNHYDIGQIDLAGLAARALEKAQSSAHPVAIEPGRYTTILEPQAMADLLVPLVDPGAYTLDRKKAENSGGPFAGPTRGISKITQSVLDHRLVLGADPMDPDGGFIPFDGLSGDPCRPVRWIDQGILRELAYDKRYALMKLGRDQALPQTKNFRLAVTPGTVTATIDEMIAKTERGLLITRFSDVKLEGDSSLLCSGFTRDGVWLIEHGKITKPVKNLRFIESPLFILNNLEDVGDSVRVFATDPWIAPGHAYVAPAVRVRDFNFVSLADSV